MNKWNVDFRDMDLSDRDMDLSDSGRKLSHSERKEAGVVTSVEAASDQHCDINVFVHIMHARYASVAI